MDQGVTQKRKLDRNPHWIPGSRLLGGLTLIYLVKQCLNTSILFTEMTNAHTGEIFILGMIENPHPIIVNSVRICCFTLCREY